MRIPVVTQSPVEISERYVMAERRMIAQGPVVSAGGALSIGWTVPQGKQWRIVSCYNSLDRAAGANVAQVTLQVTSALSNNAAIRQIFFVATDALPASVNSLITFAPGLDHRTQAPTGTYRVISQGIPDVVFKGGDTISLGAFNTNAGDELSAVLTITETEG